MVGFLNKIINFVSNFLPNNILTEIKIFLSYFYQPLKLFLFLIFLTPSFLTTLYFFLFSPFFIFYYLLLFLKNVKIKHTYLVYKQNSYKHNNFIIFLKIVYWEGLFIYSFYYLYYFLKNFYNKDKKKQNFIKSFFKNKELQKTFFIKYLFKSLFYIPYKVFSISLNLTEIFSNLKFNWKLNYKIIWGYFFLNISNYYFISLKELILNNKIYYSNNLIKFNPNKIIFNKLAEATKKFSSDACNQFIMVSNKTENRSVTHFANAIKLKKDIIIYNAETSKKNLCVFDKIKDKWVNINNFQSGEGSLNKNLNPVYVTPPISTLENELSFSGLDSKKYSEIATLQISRVNFIKPMIISLYEPHTQLNEKKIIISVEHNNNINFFKKNFNNFPENGRIFIESLIDFENEFGDEFSKFSLEKKLFFFDEIMNNSFTNQDIIVFKKLFDNGNGNDTNIF